MGFHVDDTCLRVTMEVIMTILIFLRGEAVLNVVRGAKVRVRLDN